VEEWVEEVVEVVAVVVGWADLAVVTRNRCSNNLVRIRTRTPQ